MNDFRYFVRIVECGGLTAASKDLGIPKSTVSYRLQQLETSLGVRLLNRTSRSLSLTESGNLFYRHATSMLEKADLAESTVRERLMTPTGTIRFTTAVATSLFAMRHVLPDFIKRYPQVDVFQHTTDDNIDIVASGYDVAIRAHRGALADSSLVQRVLAPAPWLLFASPDYLSQHGMPQKPEDLAAHQTLSMTRVGMPDTFKLTHPLLGEFASHIKPRLCSNDLVMLKQAAQDGLGIVALPSYVCRDEIGSGALTIVLPEWTAGEAHITAVIPVRHGLLPSVRAFIDHLADKLPAVVSR